MAEFDWVKARSECCLEKFFQQLMSGAKSDVDVRSEIPPSVNEGVHFEATEAGRRLVITRSEGSTIRRVEFSKNQNAIVIETEGITLRATPGLNSAGHCTLTVEGRGSDLDLWQVRRLALESLFFDETPPAVAVGRKKQR